MNETSLYALILLLIQYRLLSWLHPDTRDVGDNCTSLVHGQAIMQRLVCHTPSLCTNLPNEYVLLRA